MPSVVQLKKGRISEVDTVRAATDLSGIGVSKGDKGKVVKVKGQTKQGQQIVEVSFGGKKLTTNFGVKGVSKVGLDDADDDSKHKLASNRYKIYENGKWTGQIIGGTSPKKAVRAWEDLEYDLSPPPGLRIEAKVVKGSGKKKPSKFPYAESDQDFDTRSRVTKDQKKGSHFPGEKLDLKKAIKAFLEKEKGNATIKDVQRMLKKLFGGDWDRDGGAKRVKKLLPSMLDISESVESLREDVESFAASSRPRHVQGMILGHDVSMAMSRLTHTLILG